MKSLKIFTASLLLSLFTIFSSPATVRAESGCIAPKIDGNRWEWIFSADTRVVFTFYPDASRPDSINLEIFSKGAVTGEQEYHTKTVKRGAGGKSIELHDYIVISAEGPIGRLSVQAGAVIDPNGAVIFGAGRTPKFAGDGDVGGTWLMIDSKPTCIPFNPSGPFLFNASNTGAITRVDASIVGLTEAWRQIKEGTSQCNAALASCQQQKEQLILQLEDARRATRIAESGAALCQSELASARETIGALQQEIARLTTELQQSKEVVQTVRGQAVYNVKRAVKYLGGVARRELASESDKKARQKAMKMVRRIILANKLSIANTQTNGGQVIDSKTLAKGSAK